MALLPTPVTGRLLRWTAGGTLENVTISDLLDQIAAGTQPNPATQKYWIDTSGLTQISIWPPGVSFTLMPNAPTVAGQRLVAIAAPAVQMPLTTAVPTVVGVTVGSAAISAPAASFALTPTAPAIGLTVARSIPAAPMTLTTAVPTVSTVTSASIAAPAAVMTLTTAVPTVVAGVPDDISSPSEGATGVSSPVTITGTSSTGAGSTAELWDGGLVPVKTATASSTATTTTCAVVIPASAGSPIPAGSIIVACLGHGSNGGGAQTVTGVAGSSVGAMTLGTSAGGLYSRGTIYYKVVGASPITSDETITFTHSSAVGTGVRTLVATVLTGQHATPAGATASGTNLSPAAVSVTPQAAGSFIFVAMGNDGADGATSTPNANTTILYEAANGTLSMGYVARSTNLTPNTTAISIGSTKTGTSNNFAALEIKAA